MTPEQILKMQEGRRKAKKKPSMRKAINAMCKSCIYDPGYGNGTWRQQVENCTASSCPLWELRPLSNTGDNDGADDSTETG